MKKIFCLLMIGAVWVNTLALAEAARYDILYIPHDNRPVSDWQTVDTVNRVDGVSVLTPPEELLGNSRQKGEPDKLWEWLMENSRRADAVVLSSDALLYGSLVNSRKHSMSEATILERAAMFKELRESRPNLKIYVFGSVMRSPRQGGGSEEPEYYAKYGKDIFHLTALRDKMEIDKLTRKEIKELRQLEKTVPKEALDDWLKRRDRNFAANMYLVDMAKQGDFNYLVLGRDDNAPYSQTHKESRLLKEAGKGLSTAEFRVLAGIDEMGLILLTRAVNDLTWQVPLVNVVYADGIGSDTVPSYSDERIEDSIRQHLTAAGGIYVPTAKRADLLMVVNTRYDGTTPEANWPDNSLPLTEHTEKVLTQTAEYLAAGYKVAFADVAFGNGSDNALMFAMAERGMLPQLNAYAGWNTATNSSGFALGQGILSLHMSEAAKNDLLKIRYLDDWVYQANVRQWAAGQLQGRSDGSYIRLNGAKDDITAYANNAVNDFAAEYLSSMDIGSVTLEFPWNRMFEADIKPINNSAETADK